MTRKEMSAEEYVESKEMMVRSKVIMKIRRASMLVIEKECQRYRGRLKICIVKSLFWLLLLQEITSTSMAESNNNYFTIFWTL